MRSTLKERDGNKVKVEVEITPEEMKEAYDVKLRELVREVRIPGFRPGKAPANMVQQKLGDEGVMADAVESAMGKWFAQAMIDLGLEAVDKPEVEMGDELPSVDKPLTFSAEVTVMPEVKLGEYKGLKVPKDTVEVTEAEVDERVERLRNEFAELKPLEGDRAVQKGDFLLADFTAMREGEIVGELEASDFLFEVGAEMIFSEVDEQVPGMKTGESKTFAVTIPEEIPSDELKGKTVDFTVIVKEIKEKVLPEITDEWVGEIAEFKSVDEFRADIRSKMESAKSYAVEQKYQAAAVAKALEKISVDLPEVVVQREAVEMLGDLRNSIEARGLTLEGYMAATGVSVDKLIETMMPRATESVKARLVLDAVAKAEGIEVGEEDLQTVLNHMANSNQIDPKELEKRLRKNHRLDALREQILRDKAAEVIITSAIAGPPEAAEGQSAAGKKPAAKKASGAADTK